MLRQPTVKVGWFEAITENFINTEGAPLFVLEQIRSRFPVALHGVALSIGSVDGVRADHLKKIARLAARIDPFQISDHLCFSRFGARQYHELLPLPRTKTMAARIVQNIDLVQTYLKRTLVLENISAYREYPQNEMPEPEFLNLIASRSGCRLLLDINNIFVNAANFRFNARRYVRAIDPKHVAQYHLAGYTDLGTHLFDTHAESVHAPVVRLFREARFHLGERPYSLERDDRIPDFRSLERETLRLQTMTPLQMPKRFDLPPAPDEKARIAATKSSPQAERLWQKQIYSHRPRSDEPVAGTLSPAGALRVYREAYAIRLGSAIRSRYPLLTSAVGAARMKALLQSYVKTHESTHEDLSLYARDLPAYLKLSPRHSDLAHLDRMLFDLFHAHVPVGTPDLFARRVRLSSAAGMWQSAFTLVRVRRGRPHILQKPKRDPQYLLCYRRQFAVEVKMLTPGQYMLAERLAKPCALSPLLAEAENKNWLPAREVRDLFRVLGLPGVLV